MEPQTAAPAAGDEAAPTPAVGAPAQQTLPLRSPKRVRLSPAQKDMVCDLLAGGARPDQIVDSFGIAKRTVFKIQRARRMQLAAQNGVSLQDATSASKKSAAIAAAAAAAMEAADKPEGSPQAAVAAAAEVAALEAPALANGAVAAEGIAVGDQLDAGVIGADALAAVQAGPSSATPPPPKKTTQPAKRVRLNVKEKLEICNFVQGGGAPTDVIAKYGISRRTFFKILHDEAGIRQTVAREHVSAETKSIRPPHFPLLDQALSAFVLSAWAARVPLNWHMVREQALALRSELLTSGKERPERVPHLERFTASEHWCQLFMRKNASKKLPSPLEDPVPARRHVAKETKSLQSQLARFDAENIYTLITPRLFYRNVPPSFFADPVAKKESESKDVPGEPTNEPYIILLIAANMTGTKRVPITVIVPTNMAKLFEMRPPRLRYQFRDTQRVDAIAFDQWVRECFMPFVMMNSTNKVALVLEEAIAMQSTFVDASENISLLSVPRLCTTMQESVKSGIFPMLVAKYRFKLFEQYSTLAPIRKALRECADGIPKYFRGLAEGHDVSIWNTAQILHDIWMELPPDRICRCWWRHNILPSILEQQLVAIHGPATDVPAIQEITSFVLQMTKSVGLGKTLGENGFNPAHFTLKPKWMTVVEVIRWFTFEYQHPPVLKQDQVSDVALDWTEPPVINDVSDVIMDEPAEERKWSAQEFVDSMKNFSYLEKTFSDIKDTEALNFLRATKDAALSSYVGAKMDPTRADIVGMSGASPVPAGMPNANAGVNVGMSNAGMASAGVNFSPPKHDGVGGDFTSVTNFPFPNMGATKPDDGEQ